MAITLLQAPATEPVSVAELKSYLRLVHDTEDELLAACIAAARDLVERHCGRAIVTRIVRESGVRRHTPGDVCVRLSLAPVTQVLSVKVADPAGAGHVLQGPFSIDASAGVLSIPFAASCASPASELEVEYGAGYGAAEDAPSALRHAVLGQAAQMFSDRSASGPCAFVRDLAAPFVRHRI